MSDLVPPARWHLPDTPDLDHLHKQAKRLRRVIAVSEPAAVDLVTTYDPGVAGRAVTLAEAQRIVARAYGFAGWSRLLEHVRIRSELSRPMAAQGPSGESAVDAFLRAACLSYTEPGAVEVAHRMLTADPGLATASAATLAACGDATGLAGLLRSDPGVVEREDGPHHWVPLLYLAYSRLGIGDPVATLRVLLSAGADPNAGFLWQGMPSPFTALTGVLGGGERDEPPHPSGPALAELLLDAGADPNDNQAFYNRAFRSDDSHLAPLFSHGAGRPHPSPWRDRLGAAYPSPEDMVGEHLRSAAAAGFTARVALLLSYGVAVDTRGYHPINGDATPYELAVRHGHRAIADQLLAAGADAARISEVDAYVAALLAGEPVAVELPPDLVRRQRPEAVQLAAAQHGLAAVERLLAAGYLVDDAGRDGTTALHEAALAGSVELCTWLLAHGADPAVRDHRFNSTPAGWAEHAGHLELVELLRVTRVR